METAHIIRWNVVSAKLLSSHLSGHYRSKIVHGWCPPPVQLQSGILGLDSVVTGEVLNKALRRAVAGLGSRPPPLITVSSAVGSCL